MSMVWRFAPQFDKEVVEGVLTIDKANEVCVGGSCYTTSFTAWEKTKPLTDITEQRRKNMYRES
jgi:hypothetical protein